MERAQLGRFALLVDRVDELVLPDAGERHVADLDDTGHAISGNE
jgi:hypothetical protein